MGWAVDGPILVGWARRCKSWQPSRYRAPHGFWYLDTEHVFNQPNHAEAVSDVPDTTSIPHSPRSARIGSMRAARRAGQTPARTAIRVEKATVARESQRGKLNMTMAASTPWPRA